VFPAFLIVNIRLKNYSTGYFCDFFPSVSPKLMVNRGRKKVWLCDPATEPLRNARSAGRRRNRERFVGRMWQCKV